MARFSNNLLGCLNFLTFIFSIPIFVLGVWLAIRGGSDCQKLMQGRAIAAGAFLMVVSLAGFIGACFRVTWLMWFYLVLMFLVILLHICFIVFDFAVTAKGSGGETVPGRGFKEYHLEDYSHWLRDAVEDKDQWRKIRSCLIDTEVCKNLEGSNETYSQFFKSKLSATESGCCKPPSECGFMYQRPTVWTKPTNDSSASINPDCRSWSNNNNTLCYDCNSCKAGSIANTKEYWRKSAISNTVFVAILIVIYAIGCHALRNNKEDNALPRLKGFP